MDKKVVKKMICEAIDNIPSCAEITDAYVQHGFGESDAYIKVHLKVKEETDENLIEFQNVTQNAFNTKLGFFS